MSKTTRRLEAQITWETIEILKKILKFLTAFDKKPNSNKIIGKKSQLETRSEALIVMALSNF